MSILKQNFPQTFCTFHSKNPKTEEAAKYQIQLLPEDRYSDAIELLSMQYLEDEPINSTKIPRDNVEGRNEICDMWMKIFKERLSLVCFMSGGNEIVGVNVLTVNSRNNTGLKVKNQNLKDVCNMMELTFNEADIFGKYNVNKYLGSFGICVNRKYRKCGIATELLKARVHIMKEIYLSVTASVFSVPGSQKAAEKAGFECVYKISYDDMLKISPRFNFRNKLSNFYQIQALKI